MGTILSVVDIEQEYQTNYYLTNKTQGETWYYSRFVSNGQGVWGVDTYGLSWKKDWDEREYGAVKRKVLRDFVWVSPLFFLG